MLRGFFVTGLLYGALLAESAHAKTSLTTYVRAPDPSYGVSEIATWREGKLAFIEARLSSQMFRGVQWQHVLTMVRPDDAVESEHAILAVVSGRNDQIPAKHPYASPRDLARMRALANAAQLTVACIQEVPNQPLFDGLVEDQIIAHTFAQFFQTGDDSWPLLLPMTKSVVKAMDAVSSLAKSIWKKPVQRYTVTGESKRAWTSWLTAAVDPRVVGLVPLVFDIVNFRPQLQHQKDSWGRYSDEIGDYSERSLPAMLETPRGLKLVETVDPYSYKSRLQQKKLIVHATNDPYWPIDAARHFVDDLLGDTYQLYAPNEDHDIKDRRAVDEDRAAIALAAAGKLVLPKLETKITDAAAPGNPLRIASRSDVKPRRARVWRAEAPTRDLRQAAWTVSDEPTSAKEMHVTIRAPTTGFAAAYLELTYDLDGHPFTVTSSAAVVSSGN